MATFLFVMACIASYAIVGGFSYQMIQNYARPICEYKDAGRCDSECGHSILAGISVPLWPLVGPLLLGQKMAGKSGVDKDEKRRAKEIAEAKHQAEIARIKRIEAQELDRELALARKR